MALPVQTLSKYACFIDIWPPEPSSATLSQGRGRGRGSPPRRFLTGPRVLPSPVEALVTGRIKLTLGRAELTQICIYIYIYIYIYIHILN